MDDAILISNLNDFIFCPASIYFHNLYGNQNTMTYQNKDQINGSKAHETVDENRFSTRKDVITSLEVYSERFNVVGKIDIYDGKTGTLTERKRTIKTIYDGYVFQLYAQYFGMIEAGYIVKHLEFYSMTDNKKYKVLLPEENPEMFEKFTETVQSIKEFSLETFIQENAEKCAHCIYEPACDRSLLC